MLFVVCRLKFFHWEALPKFAASPLRWPTTLPISCYRYSYLIGRVCTLFIDFLNIFPPVVSFLFPDVAVSSSYSLLQHDFCLQLYPSTCPATVIVSYETHKFLLSSDSALRLPLLCSATTFLSNVAEFFAAFINRTCHSSLRCCLV